MENIVANLQLQNKIKVEIYRYFRYESKLWAAICAHICSKKNVLANLPGDCFIASHRGTGPAINFREAGISLPDWKETKPSPNTYYHIRLSIGLVHEFERDYEHWNVKNMEFSLIIPIDLELNFTKDKFENWIKGKREEVKEKTKTKDLEQLRKLIKKYPEEAGQFSL